jgi:hypothetical protein
MPPAATATLRRRSSFQQWQRHLVVVVIVAVGCGGRHRSRPSLSRPPYRSGGVVVARTSVVAWEMGDGRWEVRRSILPGATGHHRLIPRTPKVRDFSGIWVTGGGVGMPRRCQKICLEQPPERYPSRYPSVAVDIAVRYTLFLITHPPQTHYYPYYEDCHARFPPCSRHGLFCVWISIGRCSPCRHQGIFWIVSSVCQPKGYVRREIIIIIIH